MASIPRSGIPRIIHQTWRDRRIPEGLGYPKSWIDSNPDWTYRFWTDEDLLAFFRTERPDLLDLYLAYPKGVQRADLARYCLLERYGGLYADIDTRCVGSLEPIAGDHRVVLCEEPEAHWGPAIARGLPRLWFNGTMASPPGHPLWGRVIELCRRMADRRDGDVLDNTGPLILSAVVERWPDPNELALNGCALFADIDAYGKPPSRAPWGPFGDRTISTHLWRGTWYETHQERWRARKIGRLRQMRDALFGGPRIDPAAAAAGIDAELLARPIAASDGSASVLVLLDLGAAGSDPERAFALLAALDYPKDRLHIRLYGGGAAGGWTTPPGGSGGPFGSAAALSGAAGRPRSRRAALREGRSKERNAALRAALTAEHDWVLWLDASLLHYPPDTLRRLMAAQAKIVVPHCVGRAGGPSLDRSTFLEVYRPTRAEFYEHVRSGVLRPPADWWYRRHLHDLRYLDRVPLHGVGAVMLLVDVSCHRAGLLFPELPYRHRAESEGFGLLARDLGIVPVGLPNLEVERDPAPARTAP
ncbi:glycosyltransferase [Prosthecomicrobium pneumaticum]|uniref:Glycosyl transferase n=1 Tax=Prosthecomicrobium pneumaticum TaxID=81895 RepID=A0A7W9FNN9_9HYPH|nr:glycosyltransferase [Prosthecomicrobium pneumaticum]MBB5753990.1 hypothetical protein [Prosthecomicrobium pneumaticum]